MTGTWDVESFQAYYSRNGRRVQLLDTRGLDANATSSAEVLEDIVFALADIYQEERHIAGLVYVHDISRDSMDDQAEKVWYPLELQV